jgi:large conductance mechanosensitive channel
MAEKITEKIHKINADNIRVAVLAENSNKYFGGFIEFIREQGVVGVAIGLVLGTAATVLVKSLIDNIVMPPIGVLLGSAEGLKGQKLSLGVYHGKEAFLQYGQFLNDFINFIIIALVIYIVLKLLRVDRLDKKKP